MIAPSDVTDQCLALQSRMTARAVTRLYNSFLTSLGLNVTQFSLLLAISTGKYATLAELAEGLALEQSTAVRNLQLIAKRELIIGEGKMGPGGRRYHLTGEGKDLLAEAMPRWVKAQAAMSKELGQETASQTRKLMRTLGNAATKMVSGDDDR
jgi:DNA-binding MarR family transcriptional regulator